MSEPAMDVVYLISCALNGKIPEKDRIEAMDLEAVYSFAAHHMISAAIAFTLESAGCKDRYSGSAIATAMRKTALFDRAWSGIRQKLEEAGIWYMPLKGAVLKSMYPKYGMREFVDHDILIDPARADDVKSIMVEQGFTVKRFDVNNHDCYFKETCLNFEMHRALFGVLHEEKLWSYYENVQDRLLGDGCEKRFSPEDFYIYMIAHEYKHYSISGTGLRSLMDTCIFLKKQPLDMEYVRRETEKLGMSDFENANRSLAQRLFGGEELMAADREMLDYILSSGTFGTFAHRIENKVKQNGGSKLRYALSRFFVPVSRKNQGYTDFAQAYPLFYKHKTLLPFLPFYRIIRAMKAGRFGAEAKAIKNARTQ